MISILSSTGSRKNKRERIGRDCPGSSPRANAAYTLMDPSKEQISSRINSEAGHDIIKPLSSLFLGNEELLAIHDWVLQQYK